MFELAYLNDCQHRQVSLQPGSYWLGSAPTGNSQETIVVNDTWLSPDQAIMRLDESGKLTLQNVGRPILLPTGRRIKSQVEAELQLPCSFSIGKTRFLIHSSQTPWKHDDTLATITRRLSDHNAFTPNLDEKELNSKFLQSPPAADTLVHWFDALNDLQRSTVGSEDFYQKAVQSVLDPGGLDLGLILVRRGDDWEIAASHLPFPEAGISFRRDIVDQAIREKRLWFHLGCEDVSTDDAVIPHWVVAAPVFGHDEEVVAVLYGARFENIYNHRHGIRPLEAHFVRMVADSVSSAMKRLHAEAEAARSQVLLEQTFPPKVVDILKRDLKLLQSRECEVTVLFTDLRNFSGLSESIGPQTTHQLLGDLFDQMTRIVEEHMGVVIDFYGDGLAAFWNAPVTQSNHPLLACQAALQMQQQMEPFNQQWSDLVGQPLNIGIGIHTGMAQVGNSGCHRKLKYGPRGTTVNLASRLEAATKYYRLPILVSGQTACRVDEQMMLLRLCQTQVPGIRQTVDIYQLVGQELSVSKLKFVEAYGEALQALEAKDWDRCLAILLELFHQEPNDARIDFLLQELECWSKESNLHFPHDLQQRPRVKRNPDKDCKTDGDYRALINS